MRLERRPVNNPHYDPDTFIFTEYARRILVKSGMNQLPQGSCSPPKQVHLLRCMYEDCDYYVGSRILVRECSYQSPATTRVSSRYAPMAACAASEVHTR